MKFEIPVPLKIGALVIGATLLYTYIGQLVPQKEVAAPEATKFAAEMTPEELAAAGVGLIEGKGQCMSCHTGVRAPEFDGIAERAGSRQPEFDALTYIARSMYYPNEFIVPGFNPGMTPINKPPIDLNDQEILAVIAYLQSLGGTSTVTLETTLAELGVE